MESRWIFHSFFVDDIVFAYWEHEVISTSLVSPLGSRPDNYTAIAVTVTPVLKVPQIVPSSLTFARTPSTVPLRSGARLIGHHTHAHTEGGSLLPPPPGLPTTHTERPRIPISACATPPTEHIGLAEYSRSFQFFRQVREPPPITRRHHTQGSWNFNSR